VSERDTPSGVSNFIVRPATHTDLEAAALLGAEIVRLHHATDPKRFFLIDDVEGGYAAWLAHELKRPGAVVLVAAQGEAIVGYAYGAIEDRDWGILADSHGALHDICVTASARRSGVGRALMRGMIEHLKELGAPQILLRAMVQNLAAQRLAAEFGFRPTMLEMTLELQSEPAAPAASRGNA
jgi:ribosomal protein S18 acetylase RimI-like enzyme